MINFSSGLQIFYVSGRCRVGIYMKGKIFLDTLTKQEPIKTEVDIQELKLGFTEPNHSSRPNTKAGCSMSVKRQAIRFSVNIASRLVLCGCAPLQKSPEISLNWMIWVKAYTKNYSVWCEHSLRACLHGDGGLQVGEVTRLIRWSNSPVHNIISHLSLITFTW